jgi:hypothetical protein
VFTTTNPTILASLCNPASHNVQSFVAITAVQSSKGLSAATRVTLLGGIHYAAGSTYVYLKGAVTSRNSGIGEFAIAGSRIVSLAGGVPALGAVVEIVGTQPTLGGVIVAAAVGTGTDGNPDESFDAALNGIVGSGVAASGIVGSGVLTFGIIGSGAERSGIIGSGVSSNGIVGSGAQASGIIGSGVVKQGIIGSGVALNGIVGSG